MIFIVLTEWICRENSQPCSPPCSCSIGIILDRYPAGPTRHRHVQFLRAERSTLPESRSDGDVHTETVCANEAERVFVMITKCGVAGESPRTDLCVRKSNSLQVQAHAREPARNHETYSNAQEAGQNEAKRKTSTPTPGKIIFDRSEFGVQVQVGSWCVDLLIRLVHWGCTDRFGRMIIEVRARFLDQKWNEVLSFKLPCVPFFVMYCIRYLFLHWSYPKMSTFSLCWIKFKTAAIGCFDIVHCPVYRLAHRENWK